MGDAFLPPSPPPFAIVTEPAPLRERERVLSDGKILGEAPVLAELCISCTCFWVAYSVWV